MLADRIRQLRQERRWTQADLAEKPGVHQKQVSAYERGVHAPSTDVLIKLAEPSTSPSTTSPSRPGASRDPSRSTTASCSAASRPSTSSPTRDKSLAKEILDLVIMKHRFKELVDTGGK